MEEIKNKLRQMAKSLVALKLQVLQLEEMVRGLRVKLNDSETSMQ